MVATFPRFIMLMATADKTSKNVYTLPANCMESPY